jgi:hypothetical protein
MRPSRKDGNFKYWIGVQASIRNARLRKQHEVEEAMKLQDDWTCKANNKVQVWSWAMPDMDNLQPWKDVILSERQETLNDHPPWLTRYDPLKKIWHCLEPGTLPKPKYVTFDIEGLNKAKSFRRYWNSMTPHFQDSNFAMLTGKLMVPSVPTGSEHMVVQAAVECRGCIEPEVSVFEYRHTVQASQQSFRLASLDDMLY